jgi:hypothetical protein
MDICHGPCPNSKIYEKHISIDFAMNKHSPDHFRGMGKPLKPSSLKELEPYEPWTSISIRGTSTRGAGDLPYVKPVSERSKATQHLEGFSLMYKHSDICSVKAEDLVIPLPSKKFYIFQCSFWYDLLALQFLVLLLRQHSTSTLMHQGTPCCTPSW